MQNTTWEVENATFEMQNLLNWVETLCEEYFLSVLAIPDSTASEGKSQEAMEDQSDMECCEDEPIVEDSKCGYSEG